MELLKKHSVVNRWSHWVNFPMLALMIGSGMLIYWASDVYRVGWGEFTLFHFFPDWFYQAFHIPGRLAEGMSIHFVVAWLFVLNGVAYVAYLIISGGWRQIVPRRQSFPDAWHVLLHDLGLRKEAPAQGKYNGAQRIAYSAVIVMGAGSTVTGLAIYRPVQLAWLTAMLGGYPAARLEHFLLTIGFVGFFAIHIAQVVRAGWNNFRSMVSGYELVKREEQTHGD